MVQDSSIIVPSAQKPRSVIQSLAYLLVGLLLLLSIFIVSSLAASPSLRKKLTVYYQSTQHPRIPREEFEGTSQELIRQDDQSQLTRIHSRYFEEKGVEVFITDDKGNARKTLQGFISPLPIDEWVNVLGVEVSTSLSLEERAVNAVFRKIAIVRGEDKRIVDIPESLSLKKQEWSLDKGVVIGNVGEVRDITLSEIKMGNYIVIALNDTDYPLEATVYKGATNE